MGLFGSKGSRHNDAERGMLGAEIDKNERKLRREEDPGAFDARRALIRADKSEMKALEDGRPRRQ